MAEKEAVIGGRTFRFGMLPAATAYKTLMIIIRNLGPLFTKGVATKRGKLSDQDWQTLAQDSLADAFGKLNDDEIMQAMESLFSVTSCLDQKPNGRVTFETTFQGRLLDAFKVAIEAFKVNFSDFLAEIRSRSSNGKDAGQTSSQSNQPTSTGT